MLVITPNLCFDRTLRVERFEAGAVVRPYDAVVTVGGKGVNVCRAIADLGGEAELLGLVGIDDAARFESLSRAEGLRLRSVPVPGSVRQATIILEDGGRASVLNEAGPTVGAEQADALCELASSELAEVSAAGSRVLVCSGSLPPGLPTDLYGRLAAVARGHGALSVVDGAREALVDALPFGTGPGDPQPARGRRRARRSVRRVVSRRRAPRRGAGPCVPDGRRTAGARGRCGPWSPRAPPVRRTSPRASATGWPRRWSQVRNPIGAGDALVGGLTHALSKGRPWLEAVTWGVAVASAAVEHPDAGHLDAERARQLAEGQVTVP